MPEDEVNSATGESMTRASAESDERPLLAAVQRRARASDNAEAPAAPMVYLSPGEDGRRFPLLTRAQWTLIAAGASLTVLLSVVVFLAWRKQNSESHIAAAPGVVQAVATPSSTPAPEAEANPSPPDDAAILAAVKTAVANYNPSGFAKYSLEVKDGIVTVAGEAETQPEKDGVENVVRPLPGVRAIVNNLIVRLTPVMIPARVNEAEAKRLDDAMRRQYEGAARPKEKDDEAERQRLESEREAERKRREVAAARIREEEERLRREAEDRLQREAAEYERRLEEQRRLEASRRARAEQGRLETNVLRSGTVAWSGIVDGAAEIVISGGSASVRNLSGEAPREVKSSFSAPVPRAPITVRMLSSSGRGNVTIAQEPSAANGYTTIVKVDDTAKGGAQRYEFSLRWMLQ
ncbi:MAG: BON domain-containing protein [Blastocatellales bacterium]|nr:BON domain-containing protein [Blastocatellales bacterium]